MYPPGVRKGEHLDACAIETVPKRTTKGGRRVYSFGFRVRGSMKYHQEVETSETVRTSSTRREDDATAEGAPEGTPQRTRERYATGTPGLCVTGSDCNMSAITIEHRGHTGRYTAGAPGFPVKSSNWRAAWPTNISRPETVPAPAASASLSSRVWRGVYTASNTSANRPRDSCTRQRGGREHGREEGRKQGKEGEGNNKT